MTYYVLMKKVDRYYYDEALQEELVEQHDIPFAITTSEEKAKAHTALHFDQSYVAVEELL